MDLELLFRGLLSNPHSRNQDVLRNMRRKLQRNSGYGLPHERRSEYFEVFYQMLQDPRWKLVCEATMIVVEMIPASICDTELDMCMSIILPKVVSNMGHSSTDVRRASLRLLQVYMRYTMNLQKVLRVFIRYGLQSMDKSTVKGCVLSIPLLFTEEFANENLYPLVESLSDLLIRGEPTLFYPVFLSLQRLNSLVGSDTFKMYMSHVRPNAMKLYYDTLGRGGLDDPMDDMSDAMFGGTSNDQGYVDDTAGGGTHHQTSPAYAMKHDVNQRVSPAPPPFGLSFGLFPRHLIRKSLSDSVIEKLDGLRQMVIMIQESPQIQVLSLADHLDEFLRKFVSDMIESNNYKVTLHGFELIESTVNRLETSALKHAPLIISLLLKRLGDSRLIIREQNIRVVYRIMFHFPPQVVLNQLLDNKYHRNPKIREEILNRVSAALLMFPRSEFVLPRLSSEVAPMLIDGKRSVRLAALETIAVLAQVLGPVQMDVLLGEVQSVEMRYHAFGLSRAAKVWSHLLSHCNYLLL